MTPSEYRKQLERELAERKTPRSAMSVNTPSPPDDLVILKNQDASVGDRVAALKRLDAAGFDIVRFAEYRADYLNTLRTIVKGEETSDIWYEALGVLALVNDDFAQEFLKECLADPNCEKITHAQALRLLSNDDHASFVTIARDLFNTTDDIELKKEALRALAADPEAENLMTRVFTASDQDVELRMIAAAALREVHPQGFSEHAMRILMDDNENDELRAASMATLANISATLSAEQRTQIGRAVNDLADSESVLVKDTAKRLMQRMEGSTTDQSAKPRGIKGDGGTDLTFTKNF